MPWSTWKQLFGMLTAFALMLGVPVTTRAVDPPLHDVSARDEATLDQILAEAAVTDDLASEEEISLPLQQERSLITILRHDFAQTPVEVLPPETLSAPYALVLREPVPPELIMQVALLEGCKLTDAWAEAWKYRRAVADLSQPIPHLTLARPVRHTAASSKPLSFDIPLATHPLVDTYIDYFTGSGRGFFKKWLTRAHRYIPIMQPILEAKGLPRDLVYLAMIESGFSSRAYSTAAASGFWQFIRSTGKLYGLRNDAWVDERQDFILATKAAAEYLSHLYSYFGDWHLAWAGYNAGHGRIGRALKKYGVEDFWSLIAHEGSLAKETQHYVPKMIAAALIAKSPERYGFTDIEPLSPLLYDELEVTKATDIQALARELQIDYQDLRDLNPALRHNITPPGRSFILRVPAGTKEQVLAWTVLQPEAKAPRNLREPSEPRKGYATHRVRRGDTLSGIAKRYHTTVLAVMQLNHMRNTKSLHVGQKLVVSGRHVAAKSENTAASSEKMQSKARSKKSTARKSTSSKSLAKSKATLKPTKAKSKTKSKNGHGDKSYAKPKSRSSQQVKAKSRHVAARRKAL